MPIEDKYDIELKDNSYKQSHSKPISCITTNLDYNSLKDCWLDMRDKLGMAAIRNSLKTGQPVKGYLFKYL